MSQNIFTIFDMSFVKEGHNFVAGVFWPPTRPLPPDVPDFLPQLIGCGKKDEDTIINPGPSRGRVPTEIPELAAFGKYDNETVIKFDLVETTKKNG
jgi:hypothetical protein